MAIPLVGSFRRGNRAARVPIGIHFCIRLLFRLCRIGRPGNLDDLAFVGFVDTSAFRIGLVCGERAVENGWPLCPLLLKRFSCFGPRLRGK